MSHALKLVHSKSNTRCSKCVIMSPPACVACAEKPDLHLLLRNLQKLQVERPDVVAALVVYLNDQLRRCRP